jgi:hypothetical protein
MGAVVSGGKPRGLREVVSGYWRQGSRRVAAGRGAADLAKVARIH